MSYNLMAESARPIDWEALSRDLGSDWEALELFPILNIGPGGPEALGISLPRKSVGAEAWREFQRLFGTLRKHDMTIIDMYTGTQVQDPNQLRETLMGSC